VFDRFKCPCCVIPSWVPSCLPYLVLGMINGGDPVYLPVMKGLNDMING
jgi:hypothetical protein